MSSSASKRIGYLDFLKILAILFVINSHFVATYESRIPYLNHYPLYTIINGLSGKFGVFVFALISGYFSYAAGKKKRLDQYLTGRYILFFSSCFVADTVYFFLNIGNVREIASFGMVIGQAVTLGDFFCGSLWFVRDFFFASILCFIIGKRDLDIYESFLIFVILFLLRRPFVAACVMGSVLYLIIETDYGFLKKTSVKVLMFLFFISFLFVQREENNLMYIEDTFRALFLILLFHGSNLLKGALNRKPIYWLGSVTMSVLIAHNISFFLFDRYGVADQFCISLVYLLWLITTYLIAVLIHYAIRFLNKMISRSASAFFESTFN